MKTGQYILKHNEITTQKLYSTTAEPDSGNTGHVLFCDHIITRVVSFREGYKERFTVHYHI